MPTFKIINDDGSVSEYKPIPKIPVKQVDNTNHTVPKVYPKNPVPKPMKLYPKTTVSMSKHEAQQFGESIKVGETLSIKSYDVASAVITPGITAAGEPVHPLPDGIPATIVPTVANVAPTSESSDKVIVAEFTPAIPEDASESDDNKDGIKITDPSSDAMIFSPIVKGKHAKQVQQASSDDKVYAIDQKGMDSLINAIADTLSDRFVSKDEVSSVVSSVIQGMVVPNSVK